MSEHLVEVVPVNLEPHGNADSLSVVKVYGYTVVVRTADWQGVSTGAYIPPDSVVPADREEYAFLKGHTRIRAQRLRGIMSQGLLMPAPAGSNVGDNVAEIMGITHYEPQLPGGCGTRTDDAVAPPGNWPVYDLESWYKYGSHFIDGEQVLITEKIHGANSRWLMTKDGELHVGSHRRWKKEDPRCMWWQALEQNPWMRELCGTWPGMCFYAEVFGQVQDLKYGIIPGQYQIRIFDAWDGENWREEGWGFPYLVPDLYRGPYLEAEVRLWIDGKSQIYGADHLREGIVIQALPDRYEHIGRVKLKAVSSEYLSRAKG